TSDRFNPREIASLKSRLVVDWPTLFARLHGHEHFFWEHEWEKHGTCLGFSQLEYFKRTLDLFDRLDVMGKLGYIHIFPRDEIFARDLVANFGYKFNFYSPGVPKKSKSFSSNSLKNVFKFKFLSV
ncbi:hypothetical protein FRX31_015980, partial [Thalictrum thalictroides]